MFLFEIGIEASIRDALNSLETSSAGIVLLTQNKKPLGLLSDGDLRRAFLQGATLVDKAKAYMTQDFISMHERAGRVQVLDLMQARKIEQVPILNDAGELVGLHTLHEIMKASPRNNRALIMAGGYGTRLGGLTADTPKPMLPVAGRPILERIVLHLVGHGITRMTLAVHYLSEQIVSHFGNGKLFGAQIEYLKEDEPLGTGGALGLLNDVDEPLLLLNGDLITQANVGAMLDHHELTNAWCTVGVRSYVHKVPFGCVDVKDGRVVRLEEKPDLEKRVSAGIYVISPEAVCDVPKRFFPVTELFQQGLRSGKNIQSYEVEGDWIDVGQREQLEKARGER